MTTNIERKHAKAAEQHAGNVQQASGAGELVFAWRVSAKATAENPAAPPE